MWGGGEPSPTVQTWQQEHRSASGTGGCKVAWAAGRVATDGFMASRALARRSHVRLYIIAMCAYIWQRCAAIYSERMRLLVADACGVLGAYLLEHLDPHRAGARDDLGIVETVSAAPRPIPAGPSRRSKQAGTQACSLSVPSAGADMAGLSFSVRSPGRLTCTADPGNSSWRSRALRRCATLPG